MCCQDITTYSNCSHSKTEVIPCNDSFEREDLSLCDPLRPNVSSIHEGKCSTCLNDEAEEANLADALRKIAEDEKLAPIPSNVLPKSSPSTGPRHFKHRTFWLLCCHYSDPLWTDMEREDGDPEWLDDMKHQKCPGCMKFTNEELAKKHRNKELEGKDPYGTLDKIADPEDPFPAGPSSSSARAAGSGAGSVLAPPKSVKPAAPAAAMTYADVERGEDGGDWYGATTPPSYKGNGRSKYYAEDESDSGEIDGSAYKNKGKVGARAATGQAAEEEIAPHVTVADILAPGRAQAYRQDMHSDDDATSVYDESSEYEEDDMPRGRGRAVPYHHGEDETEDEPLHSRNNSPKGGDLPRWGFKEGDKGTGPSIEVSAEERRKHGVPANMPLTQVTWDRFKARRVREAQIGMAQHARGGLDEEDGE